MMARTFTPVFACAVGAMVAAVAIWTSARADAQAARTVRITAERFAFTPAEVKVAPGTAIEFQLTSEDTAHGFRVIGHGVDVTIPKRGRGTATARFTPTEPGQYVFECSRMCGAGHSFMRGVIIVKADSKEGSR